VSKELKRVSIVMLLMFLTLFTSASIIQVFQSDNLSANPTNARTLYDSFSAQRGSILVDGKEIAKSVPYDDNFSYLREYEEGALYAPVTGYFTLNQGNTGIEGALNDYLSGTANEQFLDQLGSIFSGQDPKGASVETTIDPDVQKVAYDALGDNAGSVVAYEPKTGRILAMVSKRSYDPNKLAVHVGQDIIDEYNRLNTAVSQPLVNRAISGNLYHPGSVFKLVVTAAALESGQYTPDSTFPNPSSLTLPQSTSVIKNAGAGNCGGGSEASIATALRLSCNIPFAQLGVALGHDAIAQQATEFGFGQDLEIPMAVTPSTYPAVASDAELMLSSFGQFDDRVTPLQIAMVSGAVANGGTLMKPTLIDSIIAPDLTEIQGFTPEIFSTPMSEGTAATMTEMMVNGVANGAASNARISGVDVAGKTGTAENGAGEPYTLWFTGFAPAEDPKVAIAVVVENGGGQGQSSFGNEIAAPIAKKVLEAVLEK
jgi:peptidoglycan glycosyltransferase